MSKLSDEDVERIADAVAKKIQLPQPVWIDPRFLAPPGQWWTSPRITSGSSTAPNAPYQTWNADVHAS